MKAKSRLQRVRRQRQLRTARHLVAIVATGFLLGATLIAGLKYFVSLANAEAPTHEVQYIDRELEVVKEIEVDRTFTTEKQQILAYIVEVFGDDAADAIVVIRKCENGSFNPKATNYNRNGSVDRGIFQLNSQYWGGEELYDWKTNIDVAYKVFERAGKKWTPWSCAHVVGQKNYLNN